MGVLIVAIIIIVIVGYLKTSDKNNRTTGSFEHTNSQQSKTQPSSPWREPIGPTEHLIFFSIMAESITSYDYPYIWLIVNYRYGPGRNDTVELEYYNADELSVYANTNPGKHLRSLINSEHNVRCTFSFESEGAPYYFRSNDAVIKFISKFAPNAYVDNQLSGSDHTVIQFSKHEPNPLLLPNRISETIVNAYAYRG